MKTAITLALSGGMMTLGLLVAGNVNAAPADELTNVDVAGTTQETPFVPYQVTVPEPASGGQGPFDRSGGAIYDDGLSDSSRAMLDAVNAATP